MVSAVIDKIVNRSEPRMVGSNNSPVSNPISVLSAKVTLVFADIGSPVAETTAAGNVVVNFSESGGGSGSITIGPMRASGVTHRLSRGDFACVEQEFDMEGSALTYTISA